MFSTVSMPKFGQGLVLFEDTCTGAERSKQTPFSQVSDPAFPNHLRTLANMAAEEIPDGHSLLIERGDLNSYRAYLTPDTPVNAIDTFYQGYGQGASSSESPETFLGRLFQQVLNSKNASKQVSFISCEAF